MTVSGRRVRDVPRAARFAVRADVIALCVRRRAAAEVNNTRVWWYSVLESAVLLSISLAQVFFVRRYFEVKRTV